MKSKDELKEIDIKNRTCYYFDYTMQIIDFNFLEIFCQMKKKKKYKNILIYDISCKTTFMSLIPLSIKFNETDGSIKTYDGTSYLVNQLFK